MGNHNHNICNHNLKYCGHCDVVYCTICGREWGQQVIMNPYPAPQWPNGPFYTGDGVTCADSVKCSHS